MSSTANFPQQPVFYPLDSPLYMHYTINPYRITHTTQSSNTQRKIKISEIEQSVKAFWREGTEEVQRLKSSVKGFDLVRKNIRYLATHQQLIHIGRLMEIAGRIQKFTRNYTFFHGQSFSTAILHDVITFSTRLVAKEKEFNNARHVWRLPSNENVMTNLSKFRAFPYYGSSFQDNRVRGCILSVDATLLNKEHYESALYFYLHGTSIATSYEGRKKTFYESRANELIQFLGLKEPRFVAIIKEKFLSLVHQDWGRRAGRLSLISIPARHIESADKRVAYRSHAFGVECLCKQHGGERNRDFIRQLKLDQSFSRTKSTTPQQYRLLIQGVQNIKNVRTFSFDHLSSEKEAEYKQKFKEFAFLLKVCYDADNGNPPTKDEIEQLSTQEQFLFIDNPQSILNHLKYNQLNLTESQSFISRISLDSRSWRSILCQLGETPLYGWAFSELKKQNKMDKSKVKWIQNEMTGLHLLATKRNKFVQKFRGRKKCMRWYDTGLQFGINFQNHKTDEASLNELLARGPNLFREALLGAIKLNKVKTFFKEAFDHKGEGCYERRCELLQDFIVNHLSELQGSLDMDLTPDTSEKMSLEPFLGEYLRVFANLKAEEFASKSLDMDVRSCSSQWREIDRPQILEELKLYTDEFKVFLKEREVYQKKCTAVIDGKPQVIEINQIMNEVDLTLEKFRDAMLLYPRPKTKRRVVKVNKKKNLNSRIL